MSVGGYIGLEGVEGAGKSTVAAVVGEILEAHGREVVRVREPGGTALGEEIRRILLHGARMVAWAEASLFAAQRAQLACEVVAPALRRGAWVVSDRTYYSSLAYQGGARGLGVERVRALNELALDGVLPDLVAVLDVDPELGLSRQVATDRIGGEGLAFQQMVARTYRALAEGDPRVVVLDGTRRPEEIGRDIVLEAEERCR